MSASKAVFSFFDSAEINKSFSGKSATPRASNSALKPSTSPASLSSTSTGSHSSYKSTSSSPRASPSNSSHMGRGQPYDEVVAACSTGEISINCNQSLDESCNSQITERAANKSPIEVTRGAYNVNRIGSNVSGGAMSQLSGSNASSSVSVHSSGSGVGASESEIGKSTSSLGIQGATSGGAGKNGVVSGAGQTTREANYEEGASELFLLVESASWEEAVNRANQFPEEARVWINSSGTENTVFSWSVWRRLPLHEACRRQPPPVLIYALLAAYPQSTSAESQFGELPLHAAVRCGACAEVVNCLIAAYPAAVFARDNSGCTPLDILNGTGKMMDHDAVVAALTRTISVLTKEEQEWDGKIKSMEKEFASDKDQKRKEYEQMMESKNAEIAALKRELEQEKLATSNLAKKVIQTEKVVHLKSTLETKYQERLKKCEEDINALKTLNAQRKSKIKEIEAITAGDKKSIEQLNLRVQQLQAQLTAVCDEEETFVATTVARAECQMKVLMEAQMAFIKEQERKKERLRGRIGKLGITLPPKKFPSDFVDIESKKNEVEREKAIDEPSDEEVAEKALKAAMAQISMSQDSSD